MSMTPPVGLSGLNQAKLPVPVDVKDDLKPGTPLTYDNICRLVGELYLDSWLSLKAVKDDAHAMGEQYGKMLRDLQNENADLKRDIGEVGTDGS